MHRTSWTAATLVGVLILALGATARADSILDLTNGGGGTINGGIFTTASIQPAGSGVINSFVRLQTPNGNVYVEQGYNTDGRLSNPVRGPFDEKTDPNFTRSLTLGQVPIVIVGGVAYRVFHLDINEPSANNKKRIELTDIKIFISPSGALTTTDLSDGGALGDMIYNLDLGMNNSILLDTTFLGPGSGVSDMAALIPDSLFPDDIGAFITFYSKFGSANYESEAGYEEWFTLDDGSGRVAEPATATLLGIAIGYMAVRLRRRRQGTVPPG